MAKFRIKAKDSCCVYESRNLVYITDKIHRITGSWELAEEISNWCKTASVGEEYETDTVNVKIAEG